MNRFEKLFSLVGLLFIPLITGILIVIPAASMFIVMLPMALLGVLINVALLYVVFKDIFSRSSHQESTRYLWVMATLLVLPTVIIYLVKYGFKPR